MDDPLPPPPSVPIGLEQLLPLFIAEMRKDCAHLVRIHAGDRAELVEFAHAMRGKCGMFGEGVLYQLLTTLEDTALVSAPKEIEYIVANVVERVAQLEMYATGETSDAP